MIAFISNVFSNILFRNWHFRNSFFLVIRRKKKFWFQLKKCCSASEVISAMNRLCDQKWVDCASRLCFWLHNNSFFFKIVVYPWNQSLDITKQVPLFFIERRFFCFYDFCYLCDNQPGLIYIPKVVRVNRDSLLPSFHSLDNEVGACDGDLQNLASKTAPFSAFLAASFFAASRNLWRLLDGRIIDEALVNIKVIRENKKPDVRPSNSEMCNLYRLLPERNYGGLLEVGVHGYVNTCHSPTHYCSILELYCYWLVVQFHKKPNELHAGRAGLVEASIPISSDGTTRREGGGGGRRHARPPTSLSLLWGKKVTCVVYEFLIFDLIG